MKAWTALRPLRAIRTVMNGSGGAPVVLALLFPFKCKYGLYTNRTAAGLVICSVECMEQREKGRMEWRKRPNPHALTRETVRIFREQYRMTDRKSDFVSNRVAFHYRGQTYEFLSLSVLPLSISSLTKSSSFSDVAAASTQTSQIEVSARSGPRLDTNPLHFRIPVSSPANNFQVESRTLRIRCSK